MKSNKANIEAKSGLGIAFHYAHTERGEAEGRLKGGDGKKSRLQCGGPGLAGEKAPGKSRLTVRLILFAEHRLLVLVVSSTLEELCMGYARNLMGLVEKCLRDKGIEQRACVTMRQVSTPSWLSSRSATTRPQSNVCFANWPSKRSAPLPLPLAMASASQSNAAEF